MHGSDGPHVLAGPEYAPRLDVPPFLNCQTNMMSDIEDLPDAPQVPREIMQDMNADAFGPNRILTEEDLNREYPNRPKNEKTTLPFHELHKFLFDPLLANKGKKTGPAQRASRLKPHEIRRNIIDRFISRWRGEVGNDIYPALRLILCEKDRDRSVYASPTLLNDRQLIITLGTILKKKALDGYWSKL